MTKLLANRLITPTIAIPTAATYPIILSNKLCIWGKFGVDISDEVVKLFV